MGYQVIEYLKIQALIQLFCKLCCKTVFCTAVYVFNIKLADC